MTDVKILGINTPFVDLFGEPPVSALLAYVHQSWVSYASLYKESLPPLQKRTEPQLTRALAAHLREKQDAGEQPFAGDFFGELSEYILDKASGLPKCVARTDIEWRLYGMPAFVIEFKILDGKAPRREKYLTEGVMRFVGGRYSGSTASGAMFGLLRTNASKDQSLILIELQKNSACWQCTDVKNASQLLPEIAAFASTHHRSQPHVTPFRLAHLFISLS